MSNWSQSQWSQQPTGWPQQSVGATSKTPRNAVMWEVLGIVITGLPGLGWLYVGQVGAFATLVGAYIALVLVAAGVIVALPHIGVAITCLVVPALIGGVTWSAIRLHRYAAAHPVQPSWKRPAVAVIAWFLLLCVFIAGISFVAAMLSNGGAGGL